jgi:hypothetical protein
LVPKEIRVGYSDGFAVRSMATRTTRRIS